MEAVSGTIRAADVAVHSPGAMVVSVSFAGTGTGWSVREAKLSGEHAVHSPPLLHATVLQSDRGRTERIFQQRRMQILTADDDDACDSAIELARLVKRWLPKWCEWEAPQMPGMPATCVSLWRS